MAYETINPATGEMVKTFPQISDADLEVALTTPAMRPTGGIARSPSGPRSWQAPPPSCGRTPTISLAW